MKKETTLLDMVGQEQLDLMNRLGKIEHDPKILKSLKQIDLNVRLSFPHELFVAIDKA